MKTPILLTSSRVARDSGPYREHTNRIRTLPLCVAYWQQSFPWSVHHSLKTSGSWQSYRAPVFFGRVCKSANSDSSSVHL